MFIFNFKVNGNKFSKILFFIMILIILIILGFGIYNIFFKSSNEMVTLSDTIKSDDVFEVTTNNYTNILKAANEDIDSYVGCKIHFSGYVYRLLDFDDTQFVLARDMLISSDNQSLVVGFLCECDDAINFKDGTWVDVVGEITKGYFNGDIASLKILDIKEIDEPSDKFVCLPDDTYIPTCNMF